MSKAGELKRWTMQTERFRNGMTSQERSRMVEYTNGMYVLHSDYKALQERVRELERLLNRHGDHTPQCDSPIDDCTCGWDEVVFTLYTY